MVDKKHILGRLKTWRKENLEILKSLAEGIRYVGTSPEVVSEYEWWEKDAQRIKDLIRVLEKGKPHA